MAIALLTWSDPPEAPQVCPLSSTDRQGRDRTERIRTIRVVARDVVVERPQRAGDRCGSARRSRSAHRQDPAPAQLTSTPPCDQAISTVRTATARSLEPNRAGPAVLPRDRGFLLLNDTTGERLVGISLWDSAADADASGPVFRSHMEAVAGHLSGPPQAAICDVAASSAGVLAR